MRFLKMVVVESFLISSNGKPYFLSDFENGMLNFCATYYFQNQFKKSGIPFGPIKNDNSYTIFANRMILYL